MKDLRNCLFVIFLLLITAITKAQDLDPRAYARIPVNSNVVVAGYSYSEGGVVTDATLPVKNVRAYLSTPSLAAVHSFGFLGKTAQVSVGIPFMWAKVNGSVGESVQTIHRTGFGDTRLRFSVLVHGAPAVTAAELRKEKKRTVLGTSLTISVPTGQYIDGKLINLGTNRWAFKPEIALSQPISTKWLFDLYAGVWFFTNNNAFYPGKLVRTQNPMGSFQSHLSYNLSLRAWAALDFTYYIGGNSTVNGIPNADRQENSRIGGTFVFPVGRLNSIKLAYSTGAIIRFGANFSTYSIAWQSNFVGKPAKPKAPAAVN